ncbi:hypothetical protein CEP52_001517 [Fusarium oligoseptatum]|uniref:FAD-binding PCMH-type domain-containing protein n=1 Tax=Fusarium oligoseptatum TaxID=2604345 RepID=A0A428UIF4_9HYPO|nr:hypothetical protein CEP52_001517 [Fusarium oligoseptatum]
MAFLTLKQDVGLVGWATGGGHGYLTSEFGMGADSIIQAAVVTANSDIVTANECQNADLLWAIRGGGGGTFGVITELTVKAHTMPQATTLLLNIEKKTNCTLCCIPPFPAVTFYGVFFLYNKPNGTMETITEPLLELLHGANDTAKTTSQVAWAPSWISVFDTLPSEGSAGGGGAASASRLLPDEEASKAGVSNPSIAGSMTASSVAVDNALNPAWRETVVHLIAKESWKDSFPYTQANAALDDMTNVKGAALCSLAPDSGTYFNQVRKMGELSSHDPHGVFWCKKCVGSEAWVEQLDGELCRVADGLLAVQY